MTTWQRANLPSCTNLMLDVMLLLIHIADNDLPYSTLDDVHGTTINALIKRDWIFPSRGKIDTRTFYMITGRGRKAATVYSCDTRRYDGVCPNCGKNPVYYFPGGSRSGYCKDCLHEYDRSRAKFSKKNPDKLCPRCGKHPRHVTSGGHVKTYCTKCKNIRNQKYKKRQ